MMDGNLHVAQVTPEDARLTYRCSARLRLASVAAGQIESITSQPARIILQTDITPIRTTGSGSAVVGLVQQLRGQLGQDSIYLWCRNIPVASVGQQLKIR